MDTSQILQQTYLNNSLTDLIWFLGLFFFGLIFKKLISKYFSHIIYRFINRGNQVSIEKFDELLVKPISFTILLSFVYFATLHLQWPLEKFQIAQEFLLKAFQFIFIVSCVQIFLKLVAFLGLIFKARAEKTRGKMDDQLVPFAIEIGKITIYIIGIFVILARVFEIDVTALAAGVGVGGIAIAMASKESLENLLGSFTIFFDKPFVVGDIVHVGTITGVVEKVGFRSTRIRTFDKSIVTVPNKNMVSAELDNLGARSVRRAKFNIGLTYDSTIDQIKAIVNDIQKLIDEHAFTNQDGIVRFQEFGSSSLDIMIIYYVNSPDWEKFIDTKQDINYKIMEIVQKHNCDFAFPSTTVYLQK